MRLCGKAVEDGQIRLPEDKHFVMISSATVSAIFPSDCNGSGHGDRSELEPRFPAVMDCVSAERRVEAFPASIGDTRVFVTYFPSSGEIHWGNSRHEELCYRLIWPTLGDLHHVSARLD